MIAAVPTAVQSFIAAHAPYSMALTATMEYLPVDDLATLQGVKVYVVPSSLSEEPVTRRSEAWEYSVDVVVSKHLDAGDRTSAAWKSEMTALLTLVEEVASSLRFQDMAGSNWMGAVIAPLYDPKRLRDANVFLSVLRITYWSQQ